MSETLADSAIRGYGRSEHHLTTAQTSELLNVPVATLRWWRHTGQGPRSFRMGARKVMYRRADIETWLKSRYDDGPAA